MAQSPDKAAAEAPRRQVPNELGAALLQALSPCRPLSFSLHDSAGETLWLSSGSMGPDEHGFVLGALDVFALEPHRLCIHRKLEDGRRGLFVAARDPLGGCSGIGFAIVEGGPIDEARVITPTLRELLKRFSMLLAPRVERRVNAPQAPADTANAVAVEIPDSAPIRARQYTRLQAGSGTRRYEIQHAPAGPAQDGTIIERVVDWLIKHRQRYVAKPSSFGVPIAASTALDPGFAQRLDACLHRHEVDEGLLMLVLPAAAWSQDPERAGALLEACATMRCHVILDDFTISDAALGLLRHKAVRMLKLRPELTSAAMLDRYPRALLTACTQIARVLGIHCVAKRLDNAAAGRWFASAGIDYADPGQAAADAGGTGEAVRTRQVS